MKTGKRQGGGGRWRNFVGNVERSRKTTEARSNYSWTCSDTWKKNRWNGKKRKHKGEEQMKRTGQKTRQMVKRSNQELESTKRFLQGELPLASFLAMLYGNGWYLNKNSPSTIVLLLSESGWDNCTENTVRILKKANFPRFMFLQRSYRKHPDSKHH